MRRAKTILCLLHNTIALFALFQMKFAIITPSLITGSFAERVRFSGYLVFMMLFCILYIAHWLIGPGIRTVFFVRWVVDFAGGIVFMLHRVWQRLPVLYF
jgi:Amt family ammonium transporter